MFGRLCTLVSLWLTLSAVTAVGDDCSRIVSLSPSITESLYALDLGRAVKAVTRFCKYPADATSLPKVGGFLDLSLEAIVTHQPTIVFALSEQRDVRSSLERLGLLVRTVDHSSVTGILDSLRIIGAACDRREIAEGLRTTLERRITEVKRSVSGKQMVRTLVTVGRGQEDDSISGIFASGKDGYYNELIEISGGVNINQSSTISFPTVSAEGILRANPEVIIEIVDPRDAFRVSEERVKGVWGSFSRVSAVKTGRIHIIDEDYASIPGPRFIEVLERFSRILHPVGEQ